MGNRAANRRGGEGQVARIENVFGMDKAAQPARKPAPGCEGKARPLPAQPKPHRAFA